MSITGTLPAVALAAYPVGRSGAIALDFGTAHFFGMVGLSVRHSGTSRPMVGDSLIATTEMPWPSSCFQYVAIPAPMSAWDGAPPAGCATVVRPGTPLVITTSGLILVSRSRTTAAPQEWQAVYGPPASGVTIIAAVSGQTECSSVISSQCRCTAIFCSGVNQSPAIESPARTTVSTGSLVSP